MDTVLPKPPFIDIPGIINFRDIGGYAISSRPGKAIRRGVVFRSAQPSKVTEDGVARLQQLGIRQVYDLRSLQELNKLGQGSPSSLVREWAGAERIFAPVFREEDYSPEAIALRFKDYGSGAEGFALAYMAILEAAASANNGARPYATILAQLSSTTSPSPLLVHCSAGKDRTGVICALILSLCGVDDETIADEYALTELGLKPLHGLLVEHLRKEPAFADNPDGALRMVEAKRENMIAALKAIRDRYTSIENCVTSLGLLTPEGIGQLRQNLIVEVAQL